MERSGDKFFACTGFANDEHGRIVTSDTLDHLQQSFHRFAAEDRVHAW